MKSRSLLCSGLALASLFFGAATSRASTFAWSYNWSRAPVDVTADVSAMGHVHLTDEPLRSVDRDHSDVVATNLSTFSDAPSTNVATFTHRTYTLTMFLQDTASQESTTLQFHGEFNGDLSSASSNLANTFTGVTKYEDVALGTFLYTVTIGPYANPGPPEENNEGSISAHVDVKSKDGNPTPTPTPTPDPTPTPTPDPTPTPPNGVPEPSTIVLSCLGLSFLGMASRWKKTRKSEDQN